MGYKDREAQRKYQREWMARRRAMYLHDKSCSFCASTESLELHHFDPATKVSHSIWSWSGERRRTEIAKCIVLCRDCHIARHREERVTHCAQGHEFTDANTYISPNKGRRECRICRADRRKAA